MNSEASAFLEDNASRSLNVGIMKFVERIKLGERKNFAKHRLSVRQIKIVASMKNAVKMFAHLQNLARMISNAKVESAYIIRVFVTPVLNVLTRLNVVKTSTVIKTMCAQRVPVRVMMIALWEWKDVIRIRAGVLQRVLAKDMVVCFFKYNLHI